MAHARQESSSSSAPLRRRGVRPPEQEGLLFEVEFFWRDHQPWLLEKGYKLRPRYAPDWVPSWEGTQKRKIDCEDYVALNAGQILDATRVSDNRVVILKVISKTTYPQESSIGRYFAAETLASNPRNHCVPIFEVLQVPDNPDQEILVMPLLRQYKNPKFETIGEGVEFLRQIFYGLEFMHEHHVAHRDIGTFNLMMDPIPLYPKLYHPYRTDETRDLTGEAKHFSRTQKPVKYYITDFGMSKYYNPEQGPPRDLPLEGADSTVPELMSPDTPCDPFAFDVYCLGNVVREEFTDGCEDFVPMLGFDFMRPLVADMVQDDPSRRPTMKEAVARFNETQTKLSSWKLRSRVVMKNDTYFMGFFRWFSHWFQRIGFIFRRFPPLPKPPAPEPPNNV